MTLKREISEALNALNQRDFSVFVGLFDADAALDMPDGMRVIGLESLRDTLAAYLPRHDARFVNSVVMVDEGGLRGAVDGTMDIAAGEAASLPCVMVFEKEGERFSRLSLYLSSAP
ncbi:nuclear transport factor 2 family protein [Rhizobium cremeum]|uniref:nuclear transport factor 2 family protein n=1 Tax=Rhizobium cremeum TaxID=2813827 RepID=UPI000DE1E35B